MAQAHLIAGEANEGLEVLDRAFTHVDDTGERFWEAELHRLKGELLLLPRGSEEEAEVCFNQALKVARSQSAKTVPR